MKNKILTVAISVFATLAVCLGWFGFNQTAEAQVSNAQRWEYKAVDKGLVTVSEDKLNKMGNEGWELVAVETQQVNGDTHQVRYVFKRLKQ